MDLTPQQLQQLLLAAERRADEERQRAEKAEGRIEEERQRAEKAEGRIDEERQRAEKAEEETRKTTLEEYIEANHFHVFNHLTVESDKSLTSKGGITNPRDKLCPTSLRPWLDFIEQQQKTLGTLYNVFPVYERRFESRTILQGLGQRILSRRIADEKTLEYFLHLVVEDPVRQIIDQLKAVEEVRRAFGIGDGITFENHPHAISEMDEEAIHRRQTSAAPQTPGQGHRPNRIRPDQICIYRSDEQPAARTMLYVCEYKPPHKLTTSHLRAGLHHMDIYKDVVNRETIPTDADDLFRYHSERLTASALTQTYNYMIESGLEYGLLTTGEAIIFLWVDWEDPSTLYYHLAEPGPEVEYHPNDFHFCTAVGQYLAFSLMALGAPGENRVHSQIERKQAIMALNRWAEDFETTLRSIPNDERRPPKGSSFKPNAYVNVERSPYLLRHGKQPRRLERDPPVNKHIRKDQNESSNDDLPESPSPANRHVPNQDSHGQDQGPRRSGRIQAMKSQGGGGQGRQYCTQACLLGLVRGTPLDEACPNVNLHRQGRPDRSCHHPVNHGKFLRLLREQLEKSLDDGIIKLGLGGSRGVLFQVTLLAHGYTFVSKGTISAFIPDLKHEETIYKQLKQVQGVAVPVCLGAIDLRDVDQTYYYDHRVYIRYMMFLSWAGAKSETSISVDQVVKCLRAVHREGVAHEDVREANVLSDPTTGRVMLVDFERASIVTSILRPHSRRPLSQIVPNKRAWDHKGKKNASHRTQDLGEVKYQSDISAAVAVFSK